MQNIRPSRESFIRIVANLVRTFTTQSVNYWTTFLAGSAPVDVWVAGPSSFVLHLTGHIDLDAEDYRPEYLATVAIVPNTDPFEPEQWDVIGDETFEGQRITVGSFKSLEAAVGFALERVCVRNWYAGAQDAHDLVAV
jgi:hypothetical protein